MGKMTERCRVCGAEARHQFDAIILRKHTVGYFHCEQCGFLQTEEPFWLQEAYAEAITRSDTGILERNIHFSRTVPLLLASSFNVHGRFVDYAGGYGIFTRLMRDIGFDYYWTDPYTPNLVSRGFEFVPDAAPAEALTAFETFEHLVDPMKEIETMLSLAPTLIFSTQLLPNPVPAPGQWWYYVLEHGQHVALYSQRTLEYIAHKKGLNYYRFGLLHVLTPKSLDVLRIKMLFRLQSFGYRPAALRSLKSKTVQDFESFRTRG